MSFFRFVNKLAIYRLVIISLAHAHVTDSPDVNLHLDELSSARISMNYFDSDISKSTHTVVYFDWKMVFIFTFAEYVAYNFINAAKFELTIIHQDVNLRRESRSHGHVLMRL
jgi:hypothetical protein